MTGNRGSIAFFASYRPPVPLDIFSCPLQPKSAKDEVPMTDGKSYNYNGQVIPRAALEKILKRPIFAAKYKVNEADVNSGIIFVSERNELETLHIALTFNDSSAVKVFSLAEVFPDASPEIFSGVRLEDSGSIAGDYLVYITTNNLVDVERRQPWTKVYKTNLNTGKTTRLTPSLQADLSPAVSPSQKQIAVATFQGKKGGWKGEIEDLETNIYVMNVEKPYNRRLLVRNGGWPTWGSENIIFFHRKHEGYWGVYRFELSTGKQSRLTPDKMDAITPAAIDPTTVAVTTIYQKPDFTKEDRVEAQYRQIEIFYSTGQEPLKITKRISPMADHFNPFVIDGGARIGYHRCKRDRLKNNDDEVKQKPLFDTLESPEPNLELFRVPGAFPSFSNDGSKLAFVDNEFKKVWVADSNGLRVVYEAKDNDGVFSPVWNQNPDKDILYFCIGPSFMPTHSLDIGFIRDVSDIEDVEDEIEYLTKGFNNAFPSTSPDGTRLVFRSTRGGDARYKNLYIVNDIESGLYDEENIKQLTWGKHIDTHCQWAPKGDWIVFASSRSKDFIPNAPEKDNGLDTGYFAVYLVNAEKSDVVIRIMTSGFDFAGHINHPFFSPDGKSIVVTADLAAVSVEPISLPLFVHSVRPYGDIFTFDIDLDNVYRQDDRMNRFTRITHSRYESSTATWTLFSAKFQRPEWRQLLGKLHDRSCPYMQSNGGEIVCP